MAGVISFSRRGPMLSGPAPLLLFRLLINWISSSIWTGSQNILLGVEQTQYFL